MFAVELDWKSKLGTDALTMTIHLRQSSYCKSGSTGKGT